MKRADIVVLLDHRFSQISVAKITQNIIFFVILGIFIKDNNYIFMHKLEISREKCPNFVDYIVKEDKMLFVCKTFCLLLKWTLSY